MLYTLTKTLALILASGNDYLVQVKANQGKLHRQLQSLTRYRRPQQVATTVARGRGRVEHRQVAVYSAHGLDTQQWQGARTVLCVERQRCCGKIALIAKATISAR